ncbi:hypothetical protein AN641_01325 [Candidatus Epulonipiscioides gigas]|nr:hypothetical protein AN641_01325 [Epulopiscium sp. SCG-C07WGA-EpuloA2]
MVDTLRLREIFQDNKQDETMENNLELYFTKSEIENQLKQSKQELEKITTELEIYKKNVQKYKTLEIIDRAYETLSDISKNGIINIFKNANCTEDLLICIGDYEKLKMLWEYIVYLYLNNRKEADELAQFFDILFDKYTKIYSQYKRIEVSIGIEFDTDEHIRVGTSNGFEIKEVKFNGIKNIRNNKFIQKSLVIVG